MGKEQITIEVDAALMARLRAAGVDPASYVQSVIARKAAESLAPEQRAATNRAWAEENREAIEEYNEQVRQIGTFASRQRERRG